MCSTLCFRGAGSYANFLEKLINECLTWISPIRPQLASLMSSTGQQAAQQAKEFTERQQGTCGWQSKIQQSQRHPDASQQDPEVRGLEMRSKAGLRRLIVPPTCSEFNAHVPFHGLRSRQLLWSLSSAAALLVPPSSFLLEKCDHTCLYDFSLQVFLWI